MFREHLDRIKKELWGNVNAEWYGQGIISKFQLFCASALNVLFFFQLVNSWDRKGIKNYKKVCKSGSLQTVKKQKFTMHNSEKTVTQKLKRTLKIYGKNLSKSVNLVRTTAWKLHDRAEVWKV